SQNAILMKVAGCLLQSAGEIEPVYDRRITLAKLIRFCLIACQRSHFEVLQPAALHVVFYSRYQRGELLRIRSQWLAMIRKWKRHQASAGESASNNAERYAAVKCGVRRRLHVRDRFIVI